VFGEKMNTYTILVKTPEEKDHWEDLDVGGRIILKQTFRKIGWGGMDWIDLAQDRSHWRDLVNTVINLRVL
jgi:hypothetical protein